jgi:DNA repair exonuclease SbcCD nuclease subunit
VAIARAVDANLRYVLVLFTGSPMRFIHTADWQIGKSFRRYGEKEANLRLARLDAIERIGMAAVENEAACVLVAGDTFDHFAPADKTALEAVARMARFAAVNWFIIPGNHDPHRPDAVWDRLCARGLPGNVRPLLEPRPCGDVAGAVILPAPLLRKSETHDLTEWWDTAPSESGEIRVGLAHGAVTGFSSDQEASNPVDPARARAAGLSYMALGDWHRTLQIGERVWYAGTPEPDRHGGQQIGKALLVQIDGPQAPPQVRELVTGGFRWESREARVEDRASVEDLDASLRMTPDSFRTLLRLELTGALPLHVRSDLQRRLHDLEASFFHLEPDLDGLAARPSPEDFDTIDFDGVLRTAAERLKERMSSSTLTAAERKTAEDALIELFLSRGRSPAA